MGRRSSCRETCSSSSHPRSCRCKTVWRICGQSGSGSLQPVCRPLSSSSCWCPLQQVCYPESSFASRHSRHCITLLFLLEQTSYPVPKSGRTVKRHKIVRAATRLMVLGQASSSSISSLLRGTGQGRRGSYRSPASFVLVVHCCSLTTTLRLSPSSFAIGSKGSISRCPRLRDRTGAVTASIVCQQEFITGVGLSLKLS